MIFIPRKLFVGYILLSLGLLIAIGTSAYLAFAPNLQQPPLQQKITAEWFLYGTIVGALILLLLTLRILRIRVVIRKELSRIRSMSSYVSLSSQLHSRRLHELGPLLRDLFIQVSKINERQSLKMSAQNSLLDFLTANLQAPIAITDLFGRILYLSDDFEKKMDSEREQLLGSSIEKLISNAYMQTIVGNIGSQTLYKKEQSEDLAFNVFPIYNRNREPTYLVFDLRTTSEFSKVFGSGTKENNQRESRKGPPGGFQNWDNVQRFIGRFIKFRKPRD